jgi:hypothetical protein
MGVESNLASGRIPYPQDVRLEHSAAVDFLPQYLHNSFPDPSGRPDPKIRDDFYGTRRKLRIGVLGAGVCCINFLHFAKERLRDVEVVVYEKNEDVGGVVRFWVNECITTVTDTYTSGSPAIILVVVAVCLPERVFKDADLNSHFSDIPSIVYQFSWRPNKFWSEMYAPAAENLAYIRMVTEENDLYKYMKFRHEILEASWTDEETMWKLKVKDLKSESTFDDKVHVFLELNGPVRYLYSASMTESHNFC